MPRHLSLLIGLATTCGLFGCPAGTPAPPPPPANSGTATTANEDADDAESVASGADEATESPMEHTAEGNAADNGETANGFETPAAAFAAIQQGLKERDWRTAAESLTPESRDGLTMGMLVAGSMMAAFGDEEAAGIVAVFEKHGIEMEEPSISFSVGPAEGAPESAPEETTELDSEGLPEVEDQVGFIADMFSALEAMDSGGPDESLARWSEGELTDLTIEGDTATATLVSGTDGEPTEDVEFRRGAAGWLVHLGDDLLEMGPGEGGPMVGGPSFGPEGPAEPLAEAVLEDGLTSTIDLTFEQPFESQFFGTEFADGTLYATVKLSGEPVTNAYEYGEFQLVAAEDSTGAPLELAAPIKDKYGNEFGEEFVDTFFLDQKDTLPLLFALTPPADGAEQLSTLELSVKLKVRESTVVKDVLASLGDTITVENVGDFTINKQDADNGKPDHGLQIEFKGAEAGVEDIILLDGDGQPLDTEGSFGFGFGNSKTFGISTSGPLPEDTQMRVTLEGSESIKVVPLKFEDLELER